MLMPRTSSSSSTESHPCFLGRRAALSLTSLKRETHGATLTQGAVDYEESPDVQSPPRNDINGGVESSWRASQDFEF